MCMDDKEITIKMSEKEMISKFFEISEVLYENDPADTMCYENKASDEYDVEAKIIIDHFVADPESMSVEKVKTIFDERFDGYFSEEKIEECYPSIKRILNS